MPPTAMPPDCATRVNPSSESSGEPEGRGWDMLPSLVVKAGGVWGLSEEGRGREVGGGEEIKSGLSAKVKRTLVGRCTAGIERA